MTTCRKKVLHLNPVNFEIQALNVWALAQKLVHFDVFDILKFYFVLTVKLIQLVKLYQKTCMHDAYSKYLQYNYFSSLIRWPACNNRCDTLS